MYAVTLHSPWAFAVLFLGKPFENRTWRPYRIAVGQRIAIHGSVMPTGSARARAYVAYDRLIRDGLCPPGVPFSRTLMPGIVGTARLLGYETASSDPWFHGPYGWRLSDPITLPVPVPVRGGQRLWTVPAAAEAEVVRQLERMTA